MVPLGAPVPSGPVTSPLTAKANRYRYTEFCEPLILRVTLTVPRNGKSITENVGVVQFLIRISHVGDSAGFGLFGHIRKVD